MSRDMSFVGKFLTVFVLFFLVSAFLVGCGSEVDPETGNTVKVGSFIAVPGREDEGLVYHKTSKTVYVLERMSPGSTTSTGYCALYRKDGQFWKYDEESKEIVPEGV